MSRFILCVHDARLKVIINFEGIQFLETKKLWSLVVYMNPINLWTQLICWSKGHYLKASSFLRKQKVMVISGMNLICWSNVISDEWAREEDRNKYFDGTRYNRAWVLGRLHHG